MTEENIKISQFYIEYPNPNFDDTEPESEDNPRFLYKLADIVGVSTTWEIK